jgi:3-hydroxyisobutyrate dehydrogenase-like beta-hydroxyacid dehydrogenase
MKVGFIGLGNMGLSMAKNILKSTKTKSGFLMVYDLKKENMNFFNEQEVKFASSTQDISKSCDIIITMLPNTPNVVSCLQGENGIFRKSKPGTLVIDCSTIDPIASQQLHAEAVANGIKMLDAPVSGGVTGAAAGTLTFMVGGKEEDLNDAKVYKLYCNYLFLF